MLFELGIADDGSSLLNPFYWRNDFVGTEQHSRLIADGRYIVNTETYQRHTRFAQEWDDALRAQDLVDAFVSSSDLS
ncbi:DUF6908 domain-containing protein [Tunturiibacter gelidiferens]|uniref:DUF6908 domain-containing protein n=1 Tax=Tunturiibacter gelidiferens TaxID=3069689 RepID=UPI003C12C530